MKLLLSISCAILLSLAACQNKDSGSSAAAVPAPANYATTPQPCNAQQILPGCIPQYGQQIPQNWPNGSWYWPQQWQPTQGYCGCPSGYAPVFSQGAGMACAPHAYFTQTNVVYYNWGVNNGQPQNGQWLNIPQNQYNVNNTSSQCYSQSAQGCDVRLNNCPSGSMCQPVSGGSTIGLCVRGP